MAVRAVQGRGFGNDGGLLGRLAFGSEGFLGEGKGRVGRKRRVPSLDLVVVGEVTLVFIFLVSLLYKFVLGDPFEGLNGDGGRGVVVGGGVEDWSERSARPLRGDLFAEETAAGNELRVLGRRTTARFHVVVLTMNRPASLRRLLVSLLNAEMDEDPVDLTVWVDLAPGEMQHDRLTVELLANLSWPFGRKRVNLRKEPLAPVKKWIFCWSANAQDLSERPIIFEDDLEVSPLYYRWLKAAVGKYDGTLDLSSYTLQRIPAHMTSTEEPHADRSTTRRACLSRLWGSWGFAPKPETWSDLQHWYETRSTRTDHVPSGADGESDDTRNVEASWPIFFALYAQEKGTYVLHPSLMGAQLTLVRNSSEMYEPSSGVVNYLILTAADVVKFQFPDQLIRLNGDLTDTHSQLKQDGQAPQKRSRKPSAYARRNRRRGFSVNR